MASMACVFPWPHRPSAHRYFATVGGKRTGRPMIRETYHGRKLTARAGKGTDWGRILLTVNGEAVYAPMGRDERAALDQLRRQINAIDAEPINGNAWDARWYAPGTFEMCPAGIHPQEI